LVEPDWLFVALEVILIQQTNESPEAGLEQFAVHADMDE